MTESETRFFSVDTNATLTFQRDAAGDVSGVTLKQGGRAHEGTKVDGKK